MSLSLLSYESFLFSSLTLLVSERGTQIVLIMLAIGSPTTCFRTNTTCTALLRELEVFLSLCFLLLLLLWLHFLFRQVLVFHSVGFVLLDEIMIWLWYGLFFFFFFFVILYPMMSCFYYGQLFVCFKRESTYGVFCMLF